MILDDLTPVNPAIVVTADPDAYNLKMFKLEPARMLQLTDQINKVRLDMGLSDKVSPDALMAQVCNIASRVCATNEEYTWLVIETAHFTYKSDPLQQLKDLIRGSV